MTLTEGIYDIAPGFKAFTIEKGTKIQVVARKRRISDDDVKRCGKCKYCVKGKHNPSQHWRALVCVKRPKLTYSPR